MNFDKTTTMVKVTKDEFIEITGNVVKKWATTGAEEGKHEIGLLMTLTGVSFMAGVREILFGENEVATFTEADFDTVVEKRTYEVMKTHEGKGESMGALMFWLAGTTIAAGVCKALFPEEGSENNG